MNWIERYFSKVKYSDDCWEWQGGVSQNGYGIFYKDCYPYKAHRVSHQYFIGPLKDKYCCHHCDNKLCVNPFHLYAGTPKDNMQDKTLRGRHHNSNKQLCKKGHEFTKENTYINPKSLKRACRECLKGWYKIRDQRRKLKELGEL